MTTTYKPHGRSGAHLSGYTFPELQRNPGLTADRFTAYTLPRREGDRLYWPDGRVTDLAGQPLKASA